MIRAILTDIEGTTSSLSFVKDVLFPYSRERLPQFIRDHKHTPEVRRLMDEVCASAARTLSDEGVIEQLLAWVDEDRKIAPLKALQGLVWEAGYRQGDFRGHVYPDAAEELQRWHEQGIKLFVFSSGSVQAQELLFGHSDYGDLTPLFSGFFDTRIGAKQDAAAYRRIADQIRQPPKEILFLSDIESELDAAAQTGMTTCQLVRPGTTAGKNHKKTATFSQIDLSS